jgi:hypothetical protein
VENSFRASFLGKSEKQRLLAEVEAYFASWPRPGTA